MPTINQHRVVLPAANDVLDLRGIEPGKPTVACWIRYIPQEGVRIPLQQRHVPVKSNSKSRSSLFLGSGLMAIVNMHLQTRMRSEPPEPRCMVLDRMGADDGEAIGWAHGQPLKETKVDTIVRVDNLTPNRLGLSESTVFENHQRINAVSLSDASKSGDVL
jgi:hypothetical protein